MADLAILPEGLYITSEKNFCTVLVRRDFTGEVYTLESWPEAVEKFDNVSGWIDANAPAVSVAVEMTKEELVKKYGGYR